MIPEQPLFFTPIFRSYLWGGRNLENRLKKAIPSDGQWAESWEIVDHGRDQSVVASGPWQGWTLGQLVRDFPEAMLGIKAIEQSKSYNRVSASTTFPLLLKYLDCQRVLSVQVHPNDDYAKQMQPPDLGKTEAWYIVDASDEAVLYAGLLDGVDRSALEQAIADDQVEACLHQLKPKAGDCVFIPAGTVHALGAGLLVAELQQASDTTFRLFDWNRLGDDGKPRALHLRQALEVIDFQSGPIQFVAREHGTSPGESLLVNCDQFRLVEHRSGWTIDSTAAFRIVTVMQGKAFLHHRETQQELTVGQSLLIPAASKDIAFQVNDSAILLEGTVGDVAA
jgi:mannose-6-phosphate isomerase